MYIRGGKENRGDAHDATEYKMIGDDVTKKALLPHGASV